MSVPDPGNCFQAAVGLALSDEFMSGFTRGTLILSEKSPWRIVHGLPEGTSGPVAGRRYWHAWGELSLPRQPPVVFDYSNGKRLQVLRSGFYEIGHLDEDHVWRFTPAEARKMYRAVGHCGPWVPGWEQMGDGDRDPADPYYVH